MLGPLGTAFRDGEHQNGALLQMTHRDTPPIDHRDPPLALAMVGDPLSLHPLERVTAAGSRMATGARVKSGTDQGVGLGNHRVEASAYARSAVNL